MGTNSMITIRRSAAAKFSISKMEIRSISIARYFREANKTKLLPRRPSRMMREFSVVRVTLVAVCRGLVNRSATFYTVDLCFWAKLLRDRNNGTTEYAEAKAVN